MEDEANQFAFRLNALFQTSRGRDGIRYSQQDVVDGCKGMLTRVYLWKLRTGRAKNPSMRIVQALADFFGVSVNYFSAPVEKQPVDAEPRLDNPLIVEICEKYCLLDAQGRRVISEPGGLPDIHQ